MSLRAEDEITDVVTTEEASVITRVAPGTLRYWRSKGQGPRWFRVGERRVLYRRSDLLVWMKAAYMAANENATPEHVHAVEA
ncbi:MAG: helix-turn-helix transcriptional regulator [Actinomycetes bacterium]